MNTKPLFTLGAVLPVSPPCATDASAKLWCDLKTDEERIAFLESGRAYDTGVIARDLVDEIVHAFKCKIAIQNAIEMANGREAEWGTRAMAAFDFLYEALDGVEQHGND